MKDPEIKKAIFEAVEEQLNSPESPYVRENYDRLISEGISIAEAKRMLACVLSVELWEINTQKRGFDEDAYIKRLENLPDESYLDE